MRNDSLHFPSFLHRFNSCTSSHGCNQLPSMQRSNGPKNPTALLTPPSHHLSPISRCPPPPQHPLLAAGGAASGRRWRGNCRRGSPVSDRSLWWVWRGGLQRGGGGWNPLHFETIRGLGSSKTGSGGQAAEVPGPEVGVMRGDPTTQRIDKELGERKSYCLDKKTQKHTKKSTKKPAKIRKKSKYCQNRKTQKMKSKPALSPSERWGGKVPTQ